MNGATPSSALASSLPDRADAGGASRIGRSLSALSFWGAIALPAVYLPLLVAGVETPDGLVVFLGLFGLHVAALVGGRHYRRTAER